jgi:RNA polymerase sigma-70 factor, ECF subfamily
MNTEKGTDNQAFLRAYEEFADALFRHSFFRVSNREVALDMVQDTFMKTWNHMNKGGDVENFKAFLYTTMNHLIIDYYRKSKSGSLDALLDDGFDTEDVSVDTLQSAEMSIVMKSLDTLNDSDRNLVVKRYIDGLGIGEIAGSLGESENVISVRLHRAMEKLKKHYSNE